MKKIILFLISFFMISSFVFSQKDYTACYVCSDNSKVKYTGEDSKQKRERAKEKYNCNVVGRIPECEDCKGKI